MLLPLATSTHHGSDLRQGLKARGRRSSHVTRRAWRTALASGLLLGWRPLLISGLEAIAVSLEAIAISAS